MIFGLAFVDFVSKNMHPQSSNIFGRNVLRMPLVCFRVTSITFRAPDVRGEVPAMPQEDIFYFLLLLSIYLVFGITNFLKRPGFLKDRVH